MGRAPCCDKTKVKRGPWSADEDAKLKSYIQQHGTGGNWIALPQKIGLKRCGKSCRLRWLNYLRPNIKHGGFSDEEDNVICTLYMAIGSRWSIIAAQLPGRTDNDIKNYWNTKLKKKLLNKQHKEIQEAARRSNTTYNNGVNSNNIIIKREDYIAAQVTTTCDQSPYWPQYQLPSMPIYPSSSQQQQNNNIMTTYPENISISTISNAFDQDQLYENFDIPSITSLSPVNNYTTCFQLPNSNGFQTNFNNFTINEMDDSTVFIDSMEKTSGLGSGGLEMVNSINGTTSASAESTVSWGGDSLNSNLVCSPMVSMISYEDIPQEMQCGFGDQHHYFGFHQ